MWSVGNVAAGAAGAIAAAAGVPVAVHLGVAAVVLVIVMLAAGTRMLPARVADAHPDDGVEPEPIHLRTAWRLVRILFPIAMLGVLCAILQSAAQTWSAVYLSDVLGTTAGIAASAFVVYMAAMVVGRMTNDRWVDRFGQVRTVRAGAIVGSAGVLVAMLAAPLASVPVAFAGFALIGLGSSALFPVMIGAAGSRPGIPAGHGIAICTWLVRAGLIVAPTAIGAAADAWGLGVAFVIPLLAGVLVVLLTPVLTGARQDRARIAAAAASMS
jgi:fucose permease